MPEQDTEQLVEELYSLPRSRPWALEPPAHTEYKISGELRDRVVHALSILPPTTSAGDETYRMDADEHSAMRSALLESVEIRRPSAGDGELVERRMLNDLLAVIHRDGGHRQDEVGAEQAWMEAMMTVPFMLDAAARVKELEEALRPFANAAAGVAAFDPDFPMDGAALRASFDWYDKAQSEPLKRHSVRRSDLERARSALNPSPTEQGERS